MSDPARRRALPAGGVERRLAMRDGWPLRAMVWPAGQRGAVLLLGGRGDFIEKYAEALHDLIDAGFAVASLDWRGQGHSGRLGDQPMKGHCRDFAPWLADLGEIAAWFRDALPGPHFAVGHSMGGHLLLRHLAGAGGFSAAALLSPMLGLTAAPLGSGATRALARAMVALGRCGDFIAGGGAYVPQVPGSVRQRLLTSDSERYPDEAWWIASDPQLGIGSPTWGWLDAAFRSLAALETAPLAQLTTPLLVMTPPRDGLVDVAATRRIAMRLPAASLVIVGGAGHELLREVDAIRGPVMARLIDFLAGQS